MPAETPEVTGKCQFDWQGPSDDECVDDLLVVQCNYGAGHTGVHIGLLPADQGDAEVTIWFTTTGPLRHRDGTIFRRQFTQSTSINQEES